MINDFMVALLLSSSSSKGFLAALEFGNVGESLSVRGRPRVEKETYSSKFNPYMYICGINVTGQI